MSPEDVHRATERVLGEIAEPEVVEYISASFALAQATFFAAAGNPLARSALGIALGVYQRKRRALEITDEAAARA